jgi:transposase InsO family protein
MSSPPLSGQARVVIEEWRRHYNHDRPHSALGYQTNSSHCLLGYVELGIGRRGLSTPGTKKLSHIFGRRAMFADRPD